jgi:membrane-associated protease RseP (regulator of RpoE activity)
VAGQGIPPALDTSSGENRFAAPIGAEFVGRFHPRIWLHVLLLVLTFLTTTGVGARMAHNFAANRPPFNEPDLLGFAQLWMQPGDLTAGLPFSITLLLILLAHEFGHYFACTHYGVDASLPYFIPSPTVIGTFGAFIRVRTPIYSRRALFDVGVAGPIAGFVVLLPVLFIGMLMSKVVPGIAQVGDIVFGVPAIQRLLEMLVFPGVPHQDIYLHPMARAAWVGIFATALNLLPIGQLDGGHILYSLTGRYHRLLSRIFVMALVPMGIFYWPWLVWAALLLFFGMRHPAIYDDSPLGGTRKALAWVALALFMLCFMVAPLETNGVS